MDEFLNYIDKNIEGKLMVSLQFFTSFSHLMDQLRVVFFFFQLWYIFFLFQGETFYNISGFGLFFSAYSLFNFFTIFLQDIPSQ